MIPERHDVMARYPIDELPRIKIIAELISNAAHAAYWTDDTTGYHRQILDDEFRHLARRMGFTVKRGPDLDNAS